MSALQRYTRHYSLKISLALVQLYSPWSVLCFCSEFCYHLLPWIKPQNTRFYFPLSSSLSFALTTRGLDERRGGAECWLHFGWGHHFDVAKKLKELKKEELFTLTLIEPKKAFKRRNPAPPTRTLTQASLTKKPWQATCATPPTVRKLHKLPEYRKDTPNSEI